MNDQNKEEIIQNLIEYCSKLRAKGKEDYQIQQKLIDQGMDNRGAKHMLLNKQLPYEKPSKTKPILGMLAGIVVASIGIGITKGTDGRTIAYGAIIVGIIWFFKGLIGLSQ